MYINSKRFTIRMIDNQYSILLKTDNGFYGDETEFYAKKGIFKQRMRRTVNIYTYFFSARSLGFAGLRGDVASRASVPRAPKATGRTKMITLNICGFLFFRLVLRSDLPEKVGICAVLQSGNLRTCKFCRYLQLTNMPICIIISDITGSGS